MSRHKELAKNTILIGISQIVIAAVSFLLLPLMTAKLSVGEYGLFDLVLSYGGLVSVGLVLNVDRGAFRFLIDARKNHKQQAEVISSSLAIFLPIIATGVAIALIAALLLENWLISVVGIYLVTIAIVLATQQFVRGIGKIGVFTAGSILQAFMVGVGVIISLITLDAGVMGVFIAYIVAGLMTSIVMTIWSGVYKYVSIHSIDRETKKEILRYSLPLVPSSVSWWVFGAMDRTLITLVMGVSSNGVYAVSSRLAQMYSMFTIIFERSWVESAAVNINSKSRDQFYSDVLNLNIRLFGSFALVMLAIIALIFPILIDDSFREAELYIPLLILGGFFGSIVHYCSGILLAKKLSRTVMNTSIAAAVINLVLALSLIWSIGIWAVALSTAVAYGAMAWYRYSDIKKYGIDIKMDIKPLVYILSLFVISSTLYYSNVFIIDVANLVGALVVMILLNKGAFKSLLRLLMTNGQESKGSLVNDVKNTNR